MRLTSARHHATLAPTRSPEFWGSESRLQHHVVHMAIFYFLWPKLHCLKPRFEQAGCIGHGSRITQHRTCYRFYFPKDFCHDCLREYLTKPLDDPAASLTDCTLTVVASVSPQRPSVTACSSDLFRTATCHRIGNYSLRLQLTGTDDQDKR